MNKAFMNIQNSIPQILSRAIGTKFFLFLSLGAILSLTSCDESSVVGLDVQPSNDLLHVGWKDTTTLYTQTVKEDSLRTDELLIGSGIGLIGKFFDPVFGISNASMYTQLRIPTDITSTSNFGVNPVCDSIVLSLVYEPLTYGTRPRKAQTLNVYELLGDLSKSSTYYSGNTISKSSLDLTEFHAGHVFIPRPLDSVNNIYGPSQEPKLRPQIRARMDKNLGQLILNNGAAGSSSLNLSDEAHFQSFFKGLYITTENTSTLTSPYDGNIMRFYMGLSNLIIYYHHDSPAPDTALSYTISLGSVARFNHFSHDYSAANPLLNLQLSSTPPAPASNSVNFIQSMSGVKTKVTFPYIKNWADSGKIAINKAELVIHADTTIPPAYNTDSLAAPIALIVFGIEDDGVSPFLIPDAFEGGTYFGGTYDAVHRQYTFNIGRYIQQILDGKRQNNGLYILASNGAAYANRVMIGGGAPGPKQMKLNITYTKLH